MPSKFEVLCQQARAQITVPEVPLEPIRNAALRREWFRPRRRYGLGAAVATGLSIVAVAAATELLGVHIVFNPSGPLHVYATGGQSVPNPKREDFQRAIDQVNFPVLLPAGLPQGTTPMNLSRIAKSALFITYNLPGQSRRSNHILNVIVADPKAVTTMDERRLWHMPFGFETGGTAGSGGVLWHLANEDVIVLNSTMTPGELAHFKSTMTAAAASHAGNSSTLAAIPAANPDAAARMPRGTRLSLERDGTLRVSSDTPLKNADPTQAAMLKAVSSMSFPVVLPTELPSGTKATNFSRNASVALIFYDVPGASRSNHLLKVLIVDPKRFVAVDKEYDNAKFGVRFPGARGATQWRIGSEEIVFLRSTLTAQEMERLHNAMLAAAAKHNA